MKGQNDNAEDISILMKQLRVLLAGLQPQDKWMVTQGIQLFVLSHFNVLKTVNICYAFFYTKDK